jgi:hypothetical protein
LRRRPLAERRPTGATARLHSVTLKKKATFGIPDAVLGLLPRLQMNYDLAGVCDPGKGC